MQANIGGLNTHYELSGPSSAPVVALSHSLATDMRMWAPQLAALQAKYRLLRYDTRGHGQSDAPKGAYTLEQLADDAARLLDHLSIERAHWVGMSMGGMIGQAMALHHGERLLSLALCDTTSMLPPEAVLSWDERIQVAQREGMEPLVPTTIGRWLSPEFVAAQPDVAEQVRAMIRATPVNGYAGCGQAIQRLDYSQRLADIDVPTLIIVGAEDPGTPVADSEAMHEQIRASRLVVLPKARHLSNLEAADAFNAALLGFLAEV